MTINSDRGTATDNDVTNAELRFKSIWNLVVKPPSIETATAKMEKGFGCQALDELMAANKNQPLAGADHDDFYTTQGWRRVLDSIVAASKGPNNLPKLQITETKDAHPGTDGVGITRVGDSEGKTGFFYQGFTNSPHKPFRLDPNDQTVIPPGASKGFDCGNEH